MNNGIEYVKHCCYTFSFDSLLQLVRQQKNIPYLKSITIYEEVKSSNIDIVGDISLNKKEIMEIVSTYLGVKIISFIKDYWSENVIFIAEP